MSTPLLYTMIFDLLDFQKYKKSGEVSLPLVELDRLSLDALYPPSINKSKKYIIYIVVSVKSCIVFINLGILFYRKQEGS